MEQMKISSIVKVYPNSFVLVQAVKRSKSGAITLAQVLGVCPTKEEVVAQQVLFEMLGIDIIIIPTFEETESALHIEMSKEDYKAEPLLSPAENAALFRMYYDL